MANIKTLTINGVTYELRDSTAGVLILDIPSFSSLPKTVTDSRITSDLIAMQWELGNQQAQLGVWDIIPQDGYLTIQGSISGSTTLKLYLVKER